MKKEDKVAGYVGKLRKALDMLESDEGLLHAAEVIEEARESGNTVYLLGNGGSGSTASHIVCDLAKGTIKGGERRLKAVSLAENIPLMLAWANDTEYANIFVEQLRNLLESGDVVVGISGSGNSENVVRALEYAGEKDCTTIAFTGYDGGRIKKIADVSVHVPVDDMQVVEDVHLVVGHLLMRLLQ